MHGAYDQGHDPAVALFSIPTPASSTSTASGTTTTGVPRPPRKTETMESGNAGFGLVAAHGGFDAAQGDSDAGACGCPVSRQGAIVLDSWPLATGI
jgi:hypothetical protein